MNGPMDNEIKAKIRQCVESQLLWFSKGARSDAEWLNTHTRLEPEPSRYDIAQTYLLLQILDRLDSIADMLELFDPDMAKEDDPRHYEKGGTHA